MNKFNHQKKKMVHLMNTLLNINDEREVNNNSKIDGVIVMQK